MTKTETNEAIARKVCRWEEGWVVDSNLCSPRHGYMAWKIDGHWVKDKEDFNPFESRDDCAIAEKYIEEMASVDSVPPWLRYEMALEDWAEGVQENDVGDKKYYATRRTKHLMLTALPEVRCVAMLKTMEGSNVWVSGNPGKCAS